jgi:hypothetical protein
LGRRHKVSERNGNAAQVVHDSLDVVAQLSRNRDNGGSFCDSALDKFLNIVLLLDAGVGVVNDDVDFVLQNYDLVQVHDLNSCQVLTGLRLRTGLVSSDEKQS